MSKELNYEICYEQELIGDGGIEDNPNYGVDWWDGYYTAVIKKK